MPTGTVKWYNETKGYGYIMTYCGGKYDFVHGTVLVRAILLCLVVGQNDFLVV